ncbi:hypothetical protein ACP275_08G116500 [Erythranthe tilingii]
MELGFKFQRQMQDGGGGGGGGEDSHVSLDDAYLNNLCPGVSFRALLTYSSSDEGPPYKFISDASAGTGDGVVVESVVQNPRKEKARYRRKKRGKRSQLGDKTRCLRKLLPWEGKMDMATVLEEVYKYIKFLRAQVSALQSMPCQSGGSDIHTSGGGGGGELGRLNRQQLMQVVVNSPVAQRQLYTNECCIYSVEHQI